MSAYTPAFTCEYCEKEMSVDMATPELGAVGACGCAESRSAWEAGHRAEMERRKRAKGKRVR